MKNLKFLRKISSIAMVFVIISATIEPAFGNTIYKSETIHNISVIKTILANRAEKQKEINLNALYLKAVEDSKTIEPEEILPVVPICRCSSTCIYIRYIGRQYYRCFFDTG
ncbi:MAG: hypothetical protein AB7E42_00325 [Anaerotignaceae bacterium]